MGNIAPYGVISFNPLPHAEGDTSSGLYVPGSMCFNPLPHAEGDLIADGEFFARIELDRKSVV